MEIEKKQIYNIEFTAREFYILRTILEDSKTEVQENKDLIDLITTFN